jgi:hypothetical protein
MLPLRQTRNLDMQEETDSLGSMLAGPPAPSQGSSKLLYQQFTQTAKERTPCDMQRWRMPEWRLPHSAAAHGGLSQLQDAVNPQPGVEPRRHACTSRPGVHYTRLSTTAQHQVPQLALVKARDADCKQTVNTVRELLTC